MPQTEGVQVRIIFYVEWDLIIFIYLFIRLCSSRVKIYRTLDQIAHSKMLSEDMLEKAQEG